MLLVQHVIYHKRWCAQSENPLPGQHLNHLRSIKINSKSIEFNLITTLSGPVAFPVNNDVCVNQSVQNCISVF